MRNTEAPQADAAGEASSDERLRKHTFEQVVVVIVRPRRRHRQPVFAVGNRFQAGQRRPDESAERMRQAGAMRSGARGLLLAWGGWLRTPPLRTQDSGRTVSVRHLALRRLLFAARSLARGEKNAPGREQRGCETPWSLHVGLDGGWCVAFSRDTAGTQLATRYLLKGKRRFPRVPIS